MTHSFGWNANDVNRAGLSGFDDYKIMGTIHVNQVDSRHSRSIKTIT